MQRVKLEREFHNEEFQNLYSSPKITTVVKSWMTRWAWYMACMGGGR